MLHSLRQKVEQRHTKSRKKSTSSHLIPDSTTSVQANNSTSSPSDPRSLVGTPLQGAKGYNDTDTTLSDIDISFSTLRVIFDRLKSPNSQEQLAASTELENSLISVSRDLSVEQFQRLINSVNNMIFELIHGQTSREKIGGIIAVDTLIRFYSHTEELPNQMSRLANYLRMLIPSGDIDVIRMAAITLSKLAVPSGTITSDFVETEVKKSLEWLTSKSDNTTNAKQEYRKHAALLILSAFADNSPYLLYPFINDILENIWKALRDGKKVIRTDGAALLGKCVQLLASRKDSSDADRWTRRLFNEAFNGLQLSTIESLHASLLVFRELLKAKNDKFLRGKMQEIFRSCLAYRDHRNEIIRLEIYNIFPLLAELDRKTFINKYLDQILPHYLNCIKPGKATVDTAPDKPAILVSIGDIAYVVRHRIEPYSNSILDNIREGLRSKYKLHKHFEKELFYCIGKLAYAMGPALTKQLNKDLLDLMLSCVPTSYMQETFETLIDRIPALEKTINDRLLKSLCSSLYGAKITSISVPEMQLNPVSLKNARKWRDAFIFDITGERNDDSKDDQLLIQTLGMLKNIKHEQFMLEFSRLVLIRYTGHENASVRKLAALTSIEVFADDSLYRQNPSSIQNSLAEVLGRLLSVIITDAAADTRLEVLQHLDPVFDPYLIQPGNFRMLHLSLNDEFFPVQKAAIKTLGRLSASNSPYIITTLQRTLLEQLFQLKCSTVTRKREENVTILYLLIKSSSNVVNPYVDQLLEVLLDKIQDSSSSVARTIIRSIGELAVAAGEDMKKHIPVLMPLLINTIQDQTNVVKRDAGLKSLGQLATSTEYVITPYLEYPELLGILINILQNENGPDSRAEVVRLIGTLGALDPYRHRTIEVRSDMKDSLEQNAPPIEIALLMQGMSPSNEEYYPTVAVNRLLRILSDPSLTTHHANTVQVLMNIFQILGGRSVIFLDKVVPEIISVMHACPPSLLEFYFQQLTFLVSLVRHNIKPYVGDICDAIIEFFPIMKLQSTIVDLIETISTAIDYSIKQYLPVLLNLFLNVLEDDKSTKKSVSVRILKCLISFNSALDEHSYIILPVIIKMMEFSTDSLKKAAIITLGKLAKSINLFEMSPRIVQALLHVLNLGNKELTKAAMNTLCYLLLQLRNDYIIFIPAINRVLVDNRIQHSIHDQLLSRLLSDAGLPQSFDLEEKTKSHYPDTIDNPTLIKLPINEKTLQELWNNSQERSKEDWREWLRRLSIQLLKESPSQVLRSCSSLATVYYPLARDLFNVSFASCWSELSVASQNGLVETLQSAFTSPDNSIEIFQNLLDLVEFMERDNKSLPIPAKTLAKYTLSYHSYARALHYKELEYLDGPSVSAIQALIGINNQLYRVDSSIGILKFAQSHHDLQLKEIWYEKLQRWEDALDLYDKRDETGDDSPDVIMGKVRSLYALGRWNDVFNLVSGKWVRCTPDIRRAIAPLAAGAAWSLARWDSIEQYINGMTPNSFDQEFYNAVLCLHKNDFQNSRKHIANSRGLLTVEISSLLNESYDRAYGSLIGAQAVSELEEVLAYKTLSRNSANQELIKRTWHKRLLGSRKNVDVWHRILRLRSLVIKPKDDIDIWIDFANICRDSGRMGLAKSILDSLASGSNGPVGQNTFGLPPEVVFAKLEYLWASGSRQNALEYLINFTSQLALSLGLNPENIISQSVGGAVKESPKQERRYRKLLSSCFRKQGEWKSALEPEWYSTDSNAVLGPYFLATQFDEFSYKAWHNWGLANFELISVCDPSVVGKLSNDQMKSFRFPNKADSVFFNAYEFGNFDSGNYPEKLVHMHVIPAIKAFFHSIALSESSSLQDTLRLITLWFKFGGIPDVTQAMHEGFNLVKMETWLDVLPQLISRINQKNAVVSKSLLSLLSDLGRVYPQELLYPLTVAIKSESLSRQNAALAIMKNLRVHDPILVDQGELISNELIRVAVLWHELWYEGLEDASRQFFGEHNVEKMFLSLDPLHELLRRGPETLREISFQNSFGRSLEDAYELTLMFRNTKDRSYLNEAWNIYYNVFRKISKELPHLKTLQLQRVSPKLYNARDLELAVPGSYKIGKETIRIKEFDPTLSVIASKQRPRKLTITGSNGKSYQYVLKGHEDIRQDSLVMQLFGLVNTLLENDSQCFQRRLDIRRYPAIPLSPKSGLLGWVANSDTLHMFVKEYREANNIPLNIEHWVMLQMAPDYDALTLLQKIEVFEYSLENTKGRDLAHILWLRSRSSESWLERRVTYSRSLAVMSMVGYILGLGDRHPSNLMIDRNSGKVIHIDFGDCFEAAVLREKLPEKVPFRLTRMLVNAMGIGGCEGNFRITCEHVMRVLRHNKESLMAILEAFAFDPLIRWGFDLPPEKIMKLTGIDLLSVSGEDKNMRSGDGKDENSGGETSKYAQELRNARAIMVLKRISDKLVGNDIKDQVHLDIPEQVDRLMREATSIENLCQHYIGWCPFW